MIARRLARLALGCVVTVGACGPALAHDLWIQPGRFVVETGGTTPVAVLVGHGADRERWRMRLKRVTAFDDVTPGGARHDRRDTLREAPGAPDAELRLDDPGVHVLVLTTNAALSTLSADTFEAYLREEGLTPAIEARRRSGTTGAPGRERYDRRAKALVQVGASSNRRPSRAVVPVGLSLEITPDVDPLHPGRAKALPVVVTFEGRPLPGARVKLTDLRHDAEPLEIRDTDRRGRAVFRLPRSGAWLLSVIWTRPVTGDPDADFETTFSSLAFGPP